MRFCGVYAVCATQTIARGTGGLRGAQLWVAARVQARRGDDATLFVLEGPDDTSKPLNTNKPNKPSVGYAGASLARYTLSLVWPVGNPACQLPKRSPLDTVHLGAVLRGCLAKGKSAQRESLQKASRPSKQMLHQPCHHVGGGRSQDPLAVERGCEAEPPHSVISDTFQDLGPLISQRTST